MEGIIKPSHEQSINKNTDPLSKKLSVNLTDEAPEVVRQLAVDQSVTVSEVMRRSIALYTYVEEQRDNNADILTSYDNGQRIEKVHFID
ncbi:MAG: hypothetical protein NVSMB46_03420 [Candidatus Saccharimonadales bacterium]